MKKILITGNSGYIGSHLTKLLEKDYEVYGLDKNPEIAKTTKFVQTDITSTIGANIKFDAVVHLAALVNVGESVNHPTAYMLTNVIGSLNVLQGVETDNFIFASTGAAEGMQSPYGITKRLAEDCIKEMCKVRKLPYTIFRFYNVIGTDGFEPTNQDGLMYNLMRAPDIGYFTIFGNDYNTRDGTCVRDYIHVTEICNSIKLAIEKPSNSIENLGYGKGHTVKEMVEMFKKVNQVDFEVRYIARREGDIEHSVLSNPSSYIKKVHKIEDLLKVDK